MHTQACWIGVSKLPLSHAHTRQILMVRGVAWSAMLQDLKCGVTSWRPGVLQAAGAIHTDFERGFICAEVMHYDELHELGSEAAVKAAGKYRQEVRAPICHARGGLQWGIRGHPKMHCAF